MLQFFYKTMSEFVKNNRRRIAELVRQGDDEPFVYNRNIIIGIGALLLASSFIIPKDSFATAGLSVSLGVLSLGFAWAGGHQHYLAQQARANARRQTQ